MKKNRFIIKKRKVYDVFDVERGWFHSYHTTLKGAEEEKEKAEKEKYK